MPKFVLKFYDGREEVTLDAATAEAASAKYLAAYRGKYADAPLFAVMLESGEGNDDPLVVDPSEGRPCDIALKPKLTDEFLATLVEAGKVIGHGVDYSEVLRFIHELHHRVGKQAPPDMDPYVF
ncbi:MAG TPA: hypothetical protein VF773_15900 [Verrucomicrobiae bacterium]